MKYIILLSLVLCGCTPTNRTIPPPTPVDGREGIVVLSVWANGDYAILPTVKEIK